MTDFVWQSALRQSSIRWRHVSNTEVSYGPFSGTPQTAARPGDRLACTITVSNSTGSERRRFRALAALLRGSANRIYVPDLAFQRAGSFPAAELLVNADFSNGTNGWTPGTDWALSTADGVMRLKRTAMTAAGAAIQAAAALTTSSYVPYALRYLMQGGSRTAFTVGHGAGYVGVTNFTPVSNFGYYAMAGAVSATSLTPLIYVNDTTSMVAGDYHQLPFFSMSRCMQVDGAPNLFLQSNTFANVAWTKNNVTATDNTINGPDFLGNMAKLTETAVNSTHEVGQNVTFSSSAQEIFLGCVMTALTRTWGRLRLIENTGSTVASAYFNLATGATGTTATGANWSNLRTGSVNLGAGYYYCWIIARKTNAATSVSPFAGAATADNTGSYLGVAATDAIGVWHAITAPSALPIAFNMAPTTSTVSTGATPAGSSSIYVKGGPASIATTLAVGDAFEIDKQLKFCTAPLDINAAGSGYLQFEPPIVRAVADNTPIIVQQPMCKMLMVNEPEYECVPGQISDFQFEFMQDLSS